MLEGSLLGTTGVVKTVFLVAYEYEYNISDSHAVEFDTVLPELRCEKEGLIWFSLELAYDCIAVAPE